MIFLSLFFFTHFFSSLSVASNSCSFLFFTVRYAIDALFSAISLTPLSSKRPTSSEKIKHNFSGFCFFHFFASTPTFFFHPATTHSSLYSCCFHDGLERILSRYSTTGSEPAGKAQPLCAGAAMERWCSFGASAKSACCGASPPRKGLPASLIALASASTAPSSLARFSPSSGDPTPALMKPANAGNRSPPGAEAAAATVPTEGGEGNSDSSQSQMTPLSTTQGFSAEAEGRRSLATGTEPCGLTLRSLWKKKKKVCVFFCCCWSGSRSKKKKSQLVVFRERLFFPSLSCVENTSRDHNQLTILAWRRSRRSPG